ncbi:hypothetical protein AB0I95_10880 [Micromonospora sp. NPDC049751]|uniref:hypothetical protein n=1 Tax=Micromonospora sp. NPDC049751 TaxID=3154837 RepID=UPI0033E4802F
MPTPVGDALLRFVAAQFGTLFNFPGKVLHGLIHDVYYQPSDADTQLGTGKAELQWHVEDGCHEHRPHWLVLVCLRGDPHAVTYLARASDLRFTAAQQQLIADTPVTLAWDDSFHDADQRPSAHVRTLSPGPNGREVIFDPAYTVDRGQPVEQVLALVGREADAVARPVILEHGDVLVLQNRRLLHARSSFEPKTDGAGRWIKRGLVTEDPIHAVT